MGTHQAEQSQLIDAPPKECFDALLDFESYPEWQQAVEEVEIIERHGKNGATVRFEIDAKVRRIGYTLRYHFEPPRRLWWELVEGDVADVDGEYLLEPAADGGTEATYRLGIDPGVPVPGLIARKLTRGVMRRSVTDLRDEVERRASA